MYHKIYNEMGYSARAVADLAEIFGALLSEEGYQFAGFARQCLNSSDLKANKADRHWVLAEGQGTENDRGCVELEFVMLDACIRS